MTRIAFVLLLGLLWLAVTGSASLANLVLGLSVAALSLVVLRHEWTGDVPRLRPAKALLLLGLFLKELALSAWRVMLLALKPNLALKPALFAFPLRLESDAEIALLANLITLTPGTLSVDVSPDRRFLYVHAIDCDDPARAIAEIRDGFETRIREVFA